MSEVRDRLRDRIFVGLPDSKVVPFAYAEVLVWESLAERRDCRLRGSLSTFPKQADYAARVGRTAGSL